ncbi:MAG: hypothetical protein ABJG78_01450 [Cyclobacteriaceae bacterium]
MKPKLITITLILILWGCKSGSQSEISNNSNSSVDVANKFIDAFYSFNEDTLKSILNKAIDSQPSILYYQKWAECANYKIVARNEFIVKNDSLIACPITVKDDLMGALNIDFNVTDSFHISILKNQIVSVQTTSNDLDIYYEAKDWVRTNQPELIEVPCIGIWEGGPTPCECVKGMVEGFSLFIAAK